MSSNKHWIKVGLGGLVLVSLILLPLYASRYVVTTFTRIIFFLVLIPKRWHAG